MLAFGASAPGEVRFMTEVAHSRALESCQAIDRRELPYYCGLTSARVALPVAPILPLSGVGQSEGSRERRGDRSFTLLSDLILALMGDRGGKKDGIHNHRRADDQDRRTR
jgi:hypothetical protein